MAKTPSETSRRACSRRYSIPTGKRAVSAKIGAREISEPISATGMRIWLRNGGITVDAELLWIVTATIGTNSFSVLIFISPYLFAKTVAGSTIINGLLPGHQVMNSAKEKPNGANSFVDVRTGTSAKDDRQGCRTQRRRDHARHRRWRCAERKRCRA